MKVTRARNFGGLLRQHRRSVGLTQEELAERAEVSVRGLAYLEQGKHTPRSGTVNRLADALGLSVQERATLLTLAGEDVLDRSDSVYPRVTLPVSPTRFIGREQDLGAVSDLLKNENVRLLTLTGPGGTGKTRLAIEAARRVLDRFPDGAVFVSLASIFDPDLLAFAVAQALGVRQGHGRLLTESLRSHLREKQFLLLLDNLEHLLPTATLAGDLLASCPRLKVLATSRAVLRLAAEYDYPVSPLGFPVSQQLPSLGSLIQYDAVALFVERARAAKSTFSLTMENAPAVVEICRRVDGLPLAIELAAARARLFSPQAMLVRLEKRLDLLTGGARDLPARQQTLKNAIDWSFSLLSDTERICMYRLSVFAGGCELETAENVCGDAGESNGDVLAILESLVDQSLLVVEEKDGETRFWMLETVREYGQERLTERDELEHARRRHAEAMLRLAEEAEREKDTGGHSIWLARLDREKDNLRAALAWCLETDSTAEMALRLAGALGWFWSRRQDANEGRRWLQQALDLAASTGDADLHPRARAQAVTGIADLAGTQGDRGIARLYAEQSVEIWRALNDMRGLSSALHTLGWMAQLQGDHERARSVRLELVKISNSHGTTEEEIWALHGLGRVELQQGDLAAARSRLAEALALCRQSDHAVSLIHVLCTLAEVAGCEEETVEQCRYYREACNAAKLVSTPVDLFETLHRLAWVASRLGKYTEAEQFLTDRLRLVRDQTGTEEEWWHLGWALTHLGDVARCRGDDERAESLYVDGLGFFRQHGDLQGVASILHNLGHIELHQGNARRARALFMQSLALFQELSHVWSIADCVMGLAGVAGQEKRSELSAFLYGAAESMHEAIDVSGSLVDPANQIATQREKAAARAKVNPETWHSKWRDGRLSSVEDVLVALRAWPD